MGKDWREVHVATFSGLYKAQIRTPTTADNFLLKKKKKETVFSQLQKVPGLMTFWLYNGGKEITIREKSHFKV